MYGMILQLIFVIVAVVYLLCVEPFILLIVAVVTPSFFDSIVAMSVVGTLL